MCIVNVPRNAMHLLLAGLCDTSWCARQIVIRHADAELRHGEAISR
jgi:hypothetical protein